MKNKYLKFIEAREFVRSQKLKNTYEWIKWVKENKPYNIPFRPERIYVNEFCGIKDWLGSYYLSYCEANKIVKKMNISCYHEWISAKIPENIPRYPNQVYKKNGWESWQEWLGTNNVVGSKKKYLVNEDFFKIWSHDMAYILGFWWADGCMKKDSNGKTSIFSISQHKNDSYILEEIKTKMGSNKPLDKPGKNNCNLITFHSETICNDIIKLGGKVRKSLTIDFPKNIPLLYTSDFVRGVFDGDGSIFFTKQKNYHVCITSGSFKFISKLSSVLKDNNISPSIYTDNRGNKNYNITIFKKSNNDIKNFADYIYRNNGIKLTRKYNIFQDALKPRIGTM